MQQNENGPDNKKVQAAKTGRIAGLLVSLFAAFAASAQVAQSPESGNSVQSLSEVIVTAQKRSERLIDVPISIVAVTADTLLQRGSTGLDDLSAAVPGLAIKSNGVNRQISIRGVSNLFGSSSSTIGMYLDEASVTSTSGTQLDLRTYDLERVEVLRGPQGTLYGEGSVGGTIRFLTKNPVLNRFEMSGDVAASFTEDGAPSQRIDSVLNVPLIENELGLRIAGTFDHGGGWVDEPAFNLKDFNDQNLTDVRIKGLWQPTSQFQANAMVVIHRNAAGVQRGEDSDGNYIPLANLGGPPRVEDNYELYNATLRYDFGGAQLLSTTSNIRQNQSLINLGASLPLFGPPGEAPLYAYGSPLFVFREDNLSEEIRLTSTGEGRLQWTVGSFFRRFRALVNTQSYFAGQVGMPFPLVLSNYALVNESKSSSGFGDISYRPMERLTVGVGLRYFHDDQTSANSFGPSFNSFQKGSFHSLDPRFYTQYKLTDNANVYASAAKGFRSGGFNSLNQPTYGPESVWTYELGTKARLRDGRWSVAADIFYSNYSEYQVAGLLPPPAPPLGIFRNAGEARIKGVEWDLSWYPVDGWSLSFNGDYLDTAFTRLNVTGSAYVVGDTLDYVPKYQVATSAVRDFTWQGRPGFARLDYSRQGRENYRNRSLGPWFHSESDIINTLNFKASVDMSPAVALSLFAQNLLNDRGHLDAASFEQSAARPRPRTFGVEFSVKLQ